MFDWIVDTIAEYPYVGIALAFLLCGMGLPFPEEVVLLAGGYVCAKFPDKAQMHWMMLWSAGAILAGDLLPFVLGRVFGIRLLRLRWLRLLVTKQRLAKFDRWFRRRGDLVIFIARFIAGIRMVAFFTAGTMRMHVGRFLLLDGLGIALIVPFLIFVGERSAGFIDEVILQVQRIERGMLAAGAAVVVLGLLWWWRRGKRRRRVRVPVPKETYVEPRVHVAEPVEGEHQGEGAPGREPPAPPG